METVCVVIEKISKFLEHPLIVAVVSIVLGSGLINRLIQRKEKREQKRKEAIKTAEEVSEILNDTLSCLFWQLRDENTNILEEFSLAIKNAFKYRLKFKIKFNIYLAEENLWKDYNAIIREINKLRYLIKDSKKFDEKITNEHINNLKTEWNITNDYHIEDLKYPFNIYFSWAQVIWYKTEKFVSDLLNKSLNIK